MYVHRSGFRPGVEQFCLHARSRWRLAPQGNGSLDEHIYIVHYGPSEQQYRFPSNRVQVQPEIQVQLQQRRQLEQSGQLMRKEFMLHDRANWPTINFPPNAQMRAGGMMPGNPYQQQMAARQQQYLQQQAQGGIGPSPAKRARHVPPAQMPGVGLPGAPAAINDAAVEDEENTAQGDILDHLTPRDISAMRYQQHHEWMEEIFSSPYAAGQIKPIDMGFGLTGELGQITQGLFDEPKQNEKPQQIKAYQKLQPGQLDDFEKRVNQFVKEQEAEIQRMKEEHREQMADLKQTKTYVDADRRLRDAVWSKAELDGEAPEGTVEGVVKQVEESLGVKVGPMKTVECLDKGGLIEEEPAPPPTNGNGTDQNGDLFGDSDMNGMIDNSALEGDDTAAGLLDQYGGGSLVNTPGANLSTAISQTGTPGGNGQAAPIANQAQPPVDQQGNSQIKDLGDMPAMEGMDFEMDIGDVGDPTTEGESKAPEGDWVMVDKNNGAGETSTAGQTATAATATADAASGQLQTPQEQQQNPSQDQGPTDDDTQALLDTDFSNFDDALGDTAGDALVEFTNDGGDDMGLDLDNSAFGDAFHGTEPHGDGNEEAGAS